MISSLAVILPRYGEGLGGGAEALVKAIVEQLASAKDPETYVGKIEVWTTCAKNHRTWQNELPAGESVEGGITVRRFPVDKRDIDLFLKHEIAMSQGQKLTVDEQIEWLRESVNSSGLYQHIIEYGKQFEVLLFAPYLFATSFWGAHIYPERSVIIPCLHNEAYAYQEVFRHLFSRVRGLVCNALPEKELLLSICGEDSLKGKCAVVGMGFQPSTGENGLAKGAQASASAYEKTASESYILYSGRLERGKNVDLLLTFFGEFIKRNPQSSLRLVLIGAGDVRDVEPLPERVIVRGFVSEEEKDYLLKNAFCLCQPSTNESFSIVLMEAWLRGTPVIVHGQCAVTRNHVVQSAGGLYFSNIEEFCAAISRLESDFTLRKKLGESGREYVETEYSWKAVLSRLTGAFRQFGFEVNG